jgi:hypothetical protein
LEQTYGVNLTLFEALGWEYIAPTQEAGSFVVARNSLPRWRRARQEVHCDAIPKYNTEHADARTAWASLTKRKHPSGDEFAYEKLAMLNLCEIVLPSKTPAPFESYHPKAVAAMLKATPAQICAALIHTFDL